MTTKIKAKKGKIEDIIDNLKVGALFPTPSFIIKDGHMESNQSSKAIFRHFDIKSDKSIQIEGEGKFKIDAEKIMKVIQKLKPEDMVTITFDDNETLVNGPRMRFKTTLMVPEEDELFSKIPFQFKSLEGSNNGGKYPYVTDGTIPLDTHFVLGPLELKEIVSYGKIVDLDKYTFKVDNGDVVVLVGEADSMKDHVQLKPKVRVEHSKEKMFVTFTHGIVDLAPVIKTDLNIYIKDNNKPGFFAEKTGNRNFMVVVPPVMEEDEPEVAEEPKEEPKKEENQEETKEEKVESTEDEEFF